MPKIKFVYALRTEIFEDFPENVTFKEIDERAQDINSDIGGQTWEFEGWEFVKNVCSQCNKPIMDDAESVNGFFCHCPRR